MRDDPVTDPAEVARYVERAREVQAREGATEIAEPPVVIKTARGARVMGWVTVEDDIYPE